MPPDSGPTLRYVLLVDDDESLRHAIGAMLRREGYETTAVTSTAQALAELRRRSYDAVLAATVGVDVDGLELVDEVRRRRLRSRVILMATPPSVDAALAAIHRGASDYIARPERPEEILLALRKAEERESRAAEPPHGDGAGDGTELPNRVRGSGVPGPTRELLEQVSRSPAMLELVRIVCKIADYKTTVLVTGESGTGKERIARAIHEESSRRDQPFVAVNCCAIPEALLESELFGHRRGAFTDAHRDKPGLLVDASGGTLFLDEIGDLPLGIQVKLLRVLQEQEVRPLGSSSDVKVDVRVIAATVRNLPEEVAAGRFREDLFYRLNVLPLSLPPLRERKEEIPPLVDHFIARTNCKLGTHIAGVSPDAMKLLHDHHWPGNVRELENTVERAMVLAEGDRIEVAGLPERVRQAGDRIRMTLLGGDLSIKKVTRLIEEELIRRALKETKGNRTTAAKILEISHRALLYKIKEYGIEDL